MSKKRQSDLRGFFSAKKLKPVLEETDSGHSGVSFANESVVPVEPRRVHDADLAIDEHDISESDNMPGTSKDVPIQKYDIGLFSKTCSDSEKYDFLKNTWNPASNYKFPPGKRNLKFQYQWLSEFQWLAYSEARQGAFCKICVVFASDFEAGKGTHVQLGSFVKSPFTKWKNAKQELRDHEKRGYHSNACLKAQNFFSVYENKVDDIQVQIDTQLKSAIEENRKKLSPIVKTVLFCGREGIPLRGHRDHGPLSLEESSSDGKFRSLLRFRMDAGDDILKQHLHSSGANAVYLSKNIQNEIIQIAGQLVTNSLVERIKKSHVFSILADETTDIAGIEQMSLCTRYLDKIDNKYVIREDFLKFVPVFDLRGFALSDVIKEHFSALDLDLNNVRGLGFDGAKNMSGIYNGCAAKFQESYPQATYLHCASHSLNLVLSHSCNVTEIRNCLGTINKIINFFRVSAKREKVLRDKLAEIDPPSKRTRLIKFCETRWVERQDSISLFYDMFPYIVESLEDIQQFNDSDTSSQAFAFSAAILKPVFIVSMVVACRVFNLSMVLATHMQSKQLDLKKCIDSCEKLSKELNTLRDDFKDVFNDILGTAGYVGVEMVLPRVTGQQKHRSNVDTTDPETYYRSTVFLPFIDYVLSELQERFLKHKDVLRTLQILLPKEIVNASNEELVAAVDVFINKWPNDIMKSKTSFVDELKMWRRNFSDLTEEEFNGLPDDFLSSLDKCEEMCFPCTHNVLKNCCVLPVTTSTAERSFSTLRYLKTYLRNSISTDRLNGLALLFIHKGVEVKPETIINELAKKPRRLLLK